MQAVGEALAGLGFDMDHYHQESFGSSEPQDDGATEMLDSLPQDDVKAQISFDITGVTQNCTETETVLNVARDAGIAIPSGCTFGVCGTCKIRKTSGEVQMVHNGGITEDEIEEGYILACCSYPKGDVSLDA
jgi:ferredoxin